MFNYYFVCVLYMLLINIYMYADFMFAILYTLKLAGNLMIYQGKIRVKLGHFI